MDEPGPDEMEVCMSPPSQDESGVVDMTTGEELENIKEALDDCGFEFVKACREYEQLKQAYSNLIKANEIEKENCVKKLHKEKKRFDAKITEMQRDHTKQIRVNKLLAEDLQKQENERKQLSSELLAKDASVNVIERRFEDLKNQFETISNKTPDLSTELNLTVQERDALLKENLEWRTKYDSASKKIFEHDKNIKVWEDQSEFLFREINKKEEELSANKREMDSLRSDLFAKTEKISFDEREIDSLKKEFASGSKRKDEEMQLIKNELAEVKKLIVASTDREIVHLKQLLAEERAKKFSESQSLKTEHNNKIEQMQLVSDRLKQEVVDICKRALSAESEVERLKQQHLINETSKNEEIESVRKDRSEKVQQLSSEIMKNFNVTQRNTELEKQIVEELASSAALKVQNLELKPKIAQDKNVYDCNIVILSKTINEYHKKVAESERTISELNVQLQQSRTNEHNYFISNDQREKDFESLTAANIKLKKQIEEKEKLAKKEANKPSEYLVHGNIKLKKSVESLSEENRKQSIIIGNLRNELKTESTRSSKLEKQLETAKTISQQQKTTMLSAHKDIQQLKILLEYTRNQTENNFKRSVDDVERLKREANLYIHDVINSRDSTMKQFDDYCGNLFQSLKKANDQLGSFQIENRDLNERLNTRNAELKRMKEQISALQNGNAGHFSNLKASNDLIMDRLMDCDDEGNKDARLELKINLMKIEYDYFRKQCTDKEIEAEELRKDLVQLDKKIASLDNDFAIVIEKLSLAQAEIAKLEGQLFEAQTAVETAHERGRQDAIAALRSIYDSK